MTAKEEQTINSLLKSVNDLRTDNIQFREYINKQVESINNKVEQKHLPITLENQVISSVSSAVHKATTEALSGYNGVIQKYATKAIEPFESQIISIFSNCIKESITSGEITKLAKTELLHKIVKTVISGIDGSVDKVITQMKQDSIFRSKLTLFVNQLVEEFISK